MALSPQAQFLALSLLLWVLSLTCEGAIPKCCVATSKGISPKLLRKAERIEVQRSGGVCDISALIIHIKGKKYCVHIAVKKNLRKMKRRRLVKKRRKPRLDI